MTYVLGQKQRPLMRQYDFWGTLTHKECGHCRDVLPVDLFSKSIASPDLLNNRCTPCAVKCNREKGRTTKRANNLKHMYDMTTQEWESLFESQGRCCAICGATEPGTKHGWQTDHDHITNCVRGILCLGCNCALGNIKDDPERAEKLAAYLRGLRGENVAKAKKISVDVQALYAVIEAQEKAIKALQETIDRLRNTGAGQFVFPPNSLVPPNPLVPYHPYQPVGLPPVEWVGTAVCQNVQSGEAH